LNNVYADVIDELMIVDCRYPYEFDGGHIAVSSAVGFIVICYATIPNKRYKTLNVPTVVLMWCLLFRSNSV